jgi:hypothetical protein
MATPAKKPARTTRKRRPVVGAIPEKEAPDKLIIHRPARVQLSPEETRARMEAFASEREEAFVAAVREDAD